MTYSDSIISIVISIVISISLILRLMLHYIMTIFKNVDWILPSNLLTGAVFMLWSANFHMITAFLCKFYRCLFYNYCFTLSTFISIPYYTIFANHCVSFFCISSLYHYTAITYAILYHLFLYCFLYLNNISN
jgi:hypothetical protein